MPQQTKLAPLLTIQQAGQIAESYVSQNVFLSASAGLSDNTIKSLIAGADIWCRFLAAIGVDVGGYDCTSDPRAWASVNYALIDTFVQWMLNQGYAINTVNRRLSSVRWFCTLATKAGFIPADEMVKIGGLKMIRYGQGLEIDKKRQASRVGKKKSTSTKISAYHVAKLKSLGSNDQRSIRDRLLMCLCLDHAMRASELVCLEVEDFDIVKGTVHFWRPKIKKFHTHKLTKSTLAAVGDYLALDGSPQSGKLFREIHRSGSFVGDGMTTAAIDGIIRAHGRSLGVDGLSAHDLRHNAASRAASGGTNLRSLMGLGGWNSAGTAERYLDELTIHNEGVQGID